MALSRKQRERMARLMAAETDAELELEPARPAAVDWSTGTTRQRRAKIERLLADPSATDGEQAAARAALERLTTNEEDCRNASRR